MTTTDLLIGGVIAVFAARQLRSTFLEHLHRDGRAAARFEWGTGARWIGSAGVRLAFLVWLHDVTDGAALSPLDIAQDAARGTVWHPVLVALGLTEVVGRVAALGVRAVTRGRGVAGSPR